MKTANKLLHLFFPCESNNQKARILHSSILFLISIVLIVSQIMVTLGGRSLDVLGYAANISPQEIVRLTNEKRGKRGLEPLNHNTLLSEAAKYKGMDMLEKDYWAHVSPDGIEPWRFFRDVGYQYRYAGENLARDFSNPAAVVDAWMASPSHRDNILSPKYKEIGVAVVEGDLAGTDTTIVVQLFGTQSQVSSITDISAKTSQTQQSTPTLLSPTPELIPTPTPTPTYTPILVGSTDKIGTSKSILVSPHTITRTFSAAVVGFLLVIMVVDGLVVSHKKIVRASGRVFAHLSFLGMILAIILIARSGLIL